MTTSVNPSPRRGRRKLVLRSVGSVRDTLRVKLDEFEADARVELEEIAPKIDHLEQELTAAANETTEAAAHALGRLSSAFRDLKKKASTRLRPA